MSYHTAVIWIGVLTLVAGPPFALVVWRALRKQAIALAEQEASGSNGRQRARPWSWTLLACAVGILLVTFLVGFLAGILRLFLLPSADSAVMTMLYGVWTAIFAAAFVFSRRGPRLPHSIVLIRSELAVTGDFLAIWVACTDAVKVMGALLGSQDQQSKQLEAKIPRSWRSGGERLNVSIEAGAEHTWLVKVTSDSLYPMVMYDHGKNARNVRTYIDALRARLLRP